MKKQESSRHQLHTFRRSFCLAGRGLLFALGVSWAVTGYAQEPSNELVLKELRALQDQINTLEKTVKAQQEEIVKLREQCAPATSATAEHKENDDAPKDLESRLQEFKSELLDRLAGEQSPLTLSGFFDVALQDPGEDGKPFQFGALELDIEYPFNEHFTMSSALVWDGDAAEVGAGVVDYHWFDDNVPARGRIFDEPALHIQAGRFDLPFGVDYQYFAAPDRTTVTAPLTTERIQLGGFNSDGARLYGTWKMFDFAVYAVNSLYGDDGASIGGRIGFFPWRDPYRIHRIGETRTLELGFSYLDDMDNSRGRRDCVYGADLTLNYQMFQVVAEWMERDSAETVFHEEPSLHDPEESILRNLGEQDEAGFHVTLITDLESFVKQPVSVFGRYDTWNPEYRYLIDEDDIALLHRVKDVERITLGLNYKLTEAVQLKLEYYECLGEHTTVPGLDDRRLALQLTASF